MLAAHAVPDITPVDFTVRQRYLTLTGAWVAWLFDALDAGIFGFVILAIAHSFSVKLGDVVSTVAWFLLATGIGGYFRQHIRQNRPQKNHTPVGVGLRRRHAVVQFCTRPG